MGDLVDWDLVIVGAGPAGSSAALSALQREPNLRVLILDKEPLGRDKVCGDGIGPDVPAVLRSLGVPHVLKSAESVSRFTVDTASGITLTTDSPDPGYVVPRALFDRRLMDEAVARGAHFAQGNVRYVTQSSDHVLVRTRSGNSYRSRYLVAADGANSVVRRQLKVPLNSGQHVAVAVRGYAAFTEEKQLRICWDDTNPRRAKGLVYAWAFPTADSRVNVGYGMSLSDGPVTRGHLLQRLQELHVSDADLSSVRFSGHQLPLSTHRPAVAHGRVMLTGDAASLINPLSGEGIIYALISGQAAGEAVAASKAASESYSRSLHRRLGTHFRHVKMLSFLSRYPHLVKSALRTAQHDPGTLHTILSLTLGEGGLTARQVARFPFLYVRDGFSRG